MTALAERLDHAVLDVFDVEPDDMRTYAMLGADAPPHHLVSLAALVERAERMTGGR